MWPKSIAAIIGGCLISISLMLNLNYLLPLAVDTRLFIGLLVSFPLWIAAMIWCYGSKSGWHAWQRCLSLLLVSCGINAFFIVM
ncbi:MAG: hypothetical protein HRT53_17730 [Colwellia sp.]|nr:hypothetical protein [Colwellia sp.]